MMKHQAVNPMLPSWEYIPDTEPRVFGERLYLYGSHDRFDGDSYCLNDYVCWSAPVTDLGDWRCEGTILRAVDDPANPDGSQALFAPDCVQGGDGRYYLYYCLSRTPLVSVAVSDVPEGPFTFQGYVHDREGTPVGGPGSIFGFDPGVLVDEDGRVWLYTGFGHTGQTRAMMQGLGMAVDGCYCTELEADMMTVRSAPVLVAPCKSVAQGTGFEGHAFYEASSPRKIGNTYYLVYSSELSHELCYAISDRPNGGFRYGGILVSIGDLGFEGNTQPVNYLGNTHGGLVQIGEDWYLTYHRQTNGTQFSRQCCAERVTILPDGSIPQVEMTSCGLNGGPLAARGRYPASIACNLASGEGAVFYRLNGATPEHHPMFTQSGGDREEAPDQYIRGLREGSWCAFKYFAFDGTERTIALTLRGSGRGTVTASLAPAGKAAAAVPVAPSETWGEVSVPLAPVSGTQALYLTYHGTGAVDLAALELR